MKAAVPQDQHTRLDGAQQASPAHPLAGVARPEAGVHDRMRATLHQVDAPYLRKRARPPLAVMPSEDGRIGRRIRYIFAGAIKGHQPQAKEKGALGLHRRQGAAHLMEQRHQRPCPHLRPPIGQRAGRGHGNLGVGPDVAQPLGQLRHHIAHAQMRVEVHRNEHVHRGLHRQLPRPLGDHTLCLQRRLHHLRGHSPTEGFQLQLLRKVAGSGHLT